MAHPNSQKKERLLELGENLAIWKVHIDVLREQDKNARVMQPRKFDQLTQNIKKDNRLESLPFAVQQVNEAGNEQFQIVSGHHRVRAARSAGLTEVFVIVDDSELTKGQIRSKQLSHNALSGYDDRQMLEELYSEIDDIESRIASGITDKDFEFAVEPIKIDDVALELAYENIHILFLPKQLDDFKQLCETLEKDSHLCLTEIERFDRFKAMAQATSRFHNVRNMSAILSKIVELAEAKLNEQKNEFQEAEQKDRTT